MLQGKENDKVYFCIVKDSQKQTYKNYWSVDH